MPCENRGKNKKNGIVLVTRHRSDSNVDTHGALDISDTHRRQPTYSVGFRMLRTFRRIQRTNLRMPKTEEISNVIHRRIVSKSASCATGHPSFRRSCAVACPPYAIEMIIQESFGSLNYFVEKSCIHATAEFTI